MAASSWTPGSVVHINDGTAEYDMSFINLDGFASQYRAYFDSNGTSVDLLIRHQAQAQKNGYVLTDRHNMTWIYNVPGESGGDPLSHYQASFSFETPRTGGIAVATQYLNVLPALLSVSDVRNKLLTWRA